MIKPNPTTTRPRLIVGSKTGPDRTEPRLIKPNLTNTRPRLIVGSKTVPDRTEPRLIKPNLTNTRPRLIVGSKTVPDRTEPRLIKTNPVVETPRITTTRRVTSFSNKYDAALNARGPRPPRGSQVIGSGKPSYLQPHHTHDIARRLRLRGNCGILHPIHSHYGLINYDLWCHYKPRICWWWYDWCLPLQQCHTYDCVHYDYGFVSCDYRLPTGVVLHETKWHLGITGMFLPDRGLGIETVEAGSPADLAGLQPGMVILEANGVVLADEPTMQKVIRSSGGLLQLLVQVDQLSEPVAVEVRMRRVPVSSF